MSFSLPLLRLGQVFFSHGNNSPREVCHLLQRRLAVRSGRIGRFHIGHSVEEIK